MNNKKYYIIKNKDMMITLKMLTGQQPYVYTDKFDSQKCVWSFIENEKFKEMFKFVNECIEKNR